MKKLLIAAACALSILGCEKKDPNAKPEVSSSIQYVYDQRTELCFAYIDSYYRHGPALTNVSCAILKKNGMPFESLTRIKSQ